MIPFNLRPVQGSLQFMVMTNEWVRSNLSAWTIGLHCFFFRSNRELRSAVSSGDPTCTVCNNEVFTGKLVENNWLPCSSKIRICYFSVACLHCHHGYTSFRRSRQQYKQSNCRGYEEQNSRRPSPRAPVSFRVVYTRIFTSRTKSNQFGNEISNVIAWDIRKFWIFIQCKTSVEPVDQS